MRAVNQLTRLSVLTTTIVVMATPAMARPFIKIKFKHIIPVASFDLGHGRSLDIGGGGPLGVPSVHVVNDKGFLGGLVNTVDDTVHFPVTVLSSALDFFKGPDRINDTIRHGFEQFPHLVEQFFLLIKPYLLTLSIGVPLGIVVGFLLLGLLLRHRPTPAAG